MITCIANHIILVSGMVGDSRLGGNDFDRSLAELLQEVARNQSCQATLDLAWLFCLEASLQGLLETAEDEQRLILKAEILKRQLSSSKRSESLSVSLQHSIDSLDSRIFVQVELGAECTASVSTEQFERHSAELFRRALKPVSEVCSFS